MSFVSVGGGGSARPTFFELIAAERLMPSLKSAAVYTLSVFAQRQHSLHRLLKYEDELVALIALILDRQSLASGSASFADSLYGLRRAKMQSKKGSTKPAMLNRTQQWLALLSLVGLPYLQAKLQKLHDRAQAESHPAFAGRTPQQTHRQEEQERSLFFQSLSVVKRRTLSMFLRIYPYVASTAEGLKFVYQLLYLLDAGAFYSPVHHLLGQHIVRVSGQELADAESEKLAARRSQMQRLEHLPWIVAFTRRIMLTAGHLFVDHTRNALILSVFAFKLLEWWYASAEKQLASQRQLAVPPPPPLMAPHPQGLTLPPDPTICPLCRQKRTNPAMATVSGFVFCYPCIFNHLTEHGRCPVTLIPSSIDQICRLFQGQ